MAEYKGCCGCGATIPVTPAAAPVARLLDTAPTPLVTRLLLPHVFLDEKATTNPDAAPITITIIVLNRIVRFISNPSTTVLLYFTFMKAISHRFLAFIQKKSRIKRIPKTPKKVPKKKKI